MKLTDLAARVRAIDRAFEEACCDVEATPWGAFVSNAQFSRVHTANCAWVDRWPKGLEVESLLDDVAERFRERGVRHEEILFSDPRLALHLEDRLVRAGFAVHSDHVVVHLRHPDRGPASGIEVREATGEPDAEAWWRMAAMTLEEDPRGLEDLRQELALWRQRYAALGVRPFLATADDRPVGYGSLLSRDRIGYIEQLYTLPEDRRRGIATTLVLELLHAARNAGTEFVGLMTASTNTPAQTMYGKLGFLVVGERRGFAREATGTAKTL